jgi:hypothetical protein
MESVCVCYGSNSTDCTWRYYCVPDRGPDYYQRSYDRPRAYDPPPRMVPDGIFSPPPPAPPPRFYDSNPFLEGWERTDRMMRQRY